MTPKPGARSILGSLPAYATAAVVVFVATGIVMSVWLSEDRFAGGPDPSAARVQLAATSRWDEVTLDDGRALRVIERGQTLELPPGRYRVVGLAGPRTTLVELDVARGGSVDLDAALTPDADAR